MRPDPTILAFDTSAAHCAAALLMNGQIAASRFEEMKRGQAERLMPMLDEVLGEIGAVWEELDAIGVGVGPGNFTGVRISVSAARGLSLSLGIPAVGISSFEVARFLTNIKGPFAVLLKAPHEQLMWEIELPNGSQKNGLCHQDDFGWYATHAPVVIGPWQHPRTQTDFYEIDGICVGADEKITTLNDDHSNDAIYVAQLAFKKLKEGTEISRPSPLYIRPADAAPPSDPPPKILP